MDEECIMYLQTLFRTTVVATNNPIRDHWTVDWDIATILDALDELFPVQAEHRHLPMGSCGDGVSLYRGDSTG